MIEMDLMSVIGNLGFPISAFLLMYNFATKSLNENTRAINELATIIKGKLC